MNSTPRIPPHDLIAEASLLGAMILSPKAITAATDQQLTAADFYRPAHGHVFDAIVHLAHRGLPADTLTVADVLKRDGLLEAVGGPHVLSELMQRTPAISNAARYAGIVAEMALLRRMLHAAGEIAEVAYSLPDDPDAAAEQSEQILSAAVRQGATQSTAPADVSVIAADRVEELREQRHDPSSGMGIRTGLADLDRLTRGWKPGQLIVIGARPSLGKSALAATFATAAAVAGESVLWWSGEMGRKEVTDRLMSAGASVALSKIQSPSELSDRDLDRLDAWSAEFPSDRIVVDDAAGSSVAQIGLRARELARTKHGLGLVVVDYLQILQPPRTTQNRTVDVGEISRALKVLAGQLRVPVIALSQLSRNLESRTDKRPLLSDLREGAIEADADVVIGLYRDEVYNRESSDAGIAELGIIKQRNGPVGTVKAAFLSPIVAFRDLARLP